MLVSVQGGRNVVLSEESENKGAVRLAVNYNEKSRSCVAPLKGEGHSMSCVRLTLSAISSGTVGGFQANLQRIQSSQELHDVGKEVLTMNKAALAALRWAFRPLFSFLHLQQDLARPDYLENHKHLSTAAPRSSSTSRKSLTRRGRS